MTTYQRQSHRQKKYAEDIASIYFAEEENKVKKDLLRKRAKLAQKNKLAKKNKSRK